MNGVFVNVELFTSIGEELYANFLIWHIQLSALLSLKFLFINKNTKLFWYIYDSDSEEMCFFGLGIFLIMWKVRKHTNTLDTAFQMQIFFLKPILFQ